MNDFKETLANPTVTEDMTLEEVSKGADMILGVSVAGAFTEKILLNLAKDPIIFAMANPEPEVRPEEARRIRPDCIIATGRSDYPNQVNNVMCFPFLFRAALDTRSSQINEKMKIAAADALACLARQPVPDEVKRVYPDRDFSFGKDYVIPTPFDPRLITTIPIKVAEAAAASGVARNPIQDIEAYRKRLGEINQS